MNELTFYDLIADHHYIFARKEPYGNILIQIMNYDDELVYDESSHRFAWEELVSFANMVIEQNRMIEHA